MLSAQGVTFTTIAFWRNTKYPSSAIRPRAFDTVARSEPTTRAKVAWEMGMMNESDETFASRA